MGILDLLGIGQSASAPINAVANVIEKVYTTPGEKLSAEEALLRVQQNPGMWNAMLDRINAKDVLFFNSAWRPFIGWTCGVCLALYWIPQFFLADYMWIKLCLQQNKLLPFPVDAESLVQLIYLMLGWGGYRSIEKIATIIKK